MKKLIIFFLFFSACNLETPPSKNLVTVSILPQKYFVEKISGDFFNVQVLVKKGFSPANYEPSPKQIQNLANSVFYFKIGVPFEKNWIPKINSTYPNLKIIDTAKNIKKKPVSRQKNSNQENLDPHIWLSPKLVKIQAENIYQALIVKFPEKKDFFKNNLDKFKEDLDKIHFDIKENLKNLENKTLLTFHPSWGYFADEFGLNQVSLEKEGKETSLKNLENIINLIKTKKIPVIFVQEQFSQEEAKSVAEKTGIKIIKINPLAENYLKNLEKISQTLKNSLN
jgi:zinc transport system substrate-binding protein